MYIYTVFGYSNGYEKTWSLYAFTSLEKAKEFEMRCSNALFLARSQQTFAQRSPDTFGAENIDWRTIHYETHQVELMADKFTKFAIKGITCTSTH